MIGIVTVPYIKTDAHYNLALNTYKSFPKDVYKVAVVNHVRNEKDRNLIEQFNDHVIENDQNILCRGWNLGINHLLNNGYDYALVTNLDILFKDYTLTNLLASAQRNLEAGFWAAHAINDLTHFARFLNNPSFANRSVKIQRDDQSFSAFLIRRSTYRDVGPFDEQFAPAYYEDVDYLRRLKAAGYKPIKSLDAPFWHYLQGSIRNGDNEMVRRYNKYLAANKERYYNKWKNV